MKHSLKRIRDNLDSDECLTALDHIEERIDFLEKQIVEVGDKVRIPPEAQGDIEPYGFEFTGYVTRFLSRDFTDEVHVQFSKTDRRAFATYSARKLEVIEKGVWLKNLSLYCEVLILEENKLGQVKDFKIFKDDKHVLVEVYETGEKKFYNVDEIERIEWIEKQEWLKSRKC